jgi:hypothetical protein
MSLSNITPHLLRLSYKIFQLNNLVPIEVTGFNKISKIVFLGMNYLLIYSLRIVFKLIQQF